MASKAFLEKAYLAYFGRPVDYTGARDYAATSEADVVASFSSSAESMALYGPSFGLAQINAIYNMLFGRPAEPAGLDFWYNQVQSGLVTPAGAAVAILEGAQNADAVAVTNKLAASAAFTASLDTTAEIVGYSGNAAAAAARVFLQSVTATAATQAAVDAAVATTVTGAGVGAGSDSMPIDLTSGTDRVTGTSGDDVFEANLAQNATAGGVSNTLSSADRIAGGAGQDSLYAELVPEFFGTAGSNQVDVQPRISGVETIQLEVRDINTSTTGNGSITAANTVIFDAKNVTGVNSIGSYFSDGDLVIENLTTLTDAGVARNTEAITITMDHTENFNSGEDASDLTVYFDEDYLLAGQTSSSTLELRLVNNLELATNNTALVAFTSVSFSVGAQVVTVPVTAAMTALTGADAYNALIAGIQAQLTALNITGVTVSALPLRSAVFTDDIGGFSQGAVAGFYTPIQIVSTGASLARGQAQVDNTTLNFNGLNTQLFDSATGSVPITVNVELDKVGRDGEGGNLVIGGKDQNINGDSDTDQADGIAVFNVKVMGDASLPSNLGYMSSTNQSLNTVNISSAAAAAGQTTFASLTLRDAFNGSGNLSNDDNVETVNANAFLGDLTIGTVTAASNIDTFTATGGGNITLVEDIDGDEKGVFSVTTGAGKDNITVDLDGDAVDSLNTGLFINTGGGDDTVTVTGSGGVSDETTLGLGNLSISTGAGADSINVNAEHIYEVFAGADSDFVRVDANNSIVDGETGSWSIGDGSDVAGTDWADRVLYQATLTVDFAGFTETVTIKTNAAGFFVATQQDINNAVIAAIAANPELTRLLVATTGTGTAQSQLLSIVSTVQGWNDLTIQVVQPVVVANGAVAGEVNFNAPDLGAIETGLVRTGAIADSSVITLVGDLVTVMAAIDGNLNETGAAAATDFVLDAENGADGLNNTTATSNAIIDMGTGANDLVALDSDADSADTLVFSAAWGKVSVLNFFDAQFNDAADAAAVDATTVIDHADSVVGDHILDFTAFLDDQTSASGSPLSAVRTATSLDVDTAGNLTVVSNQVSIITDFTTADTTETWAGLTGAQLQNALNGVAIGATVGYGNIVVPGAGVAAPVNLVGTTIDSIIMVENTDNRGEYKVFNAEVGNLATTDTFVVTYLGIVDFGESINTAVLGNFA